MKLNAKESDVFARSVYAELEHMTGTDEECRRRRLLRSVKDKWEKPQDKAVSIDGRQFVLPPAKPCDISMTEEELEAVTELFTRLIKDSGISSRAELDSIIKKLRSEKAGKWLILVWECTKNYIFRFSSMNGTRGDAVERLRYLKNKDMPNEDLEKQYWRTFVLSDTDLCRSRNVAINFSCGDNSYIAVPIKADPEWVFIMQHDDEGETADFEFVFHRQMSDETAKKVIRRMWSDACVGKLEDPPEAKVMKSDSGCLYANEYIPGTGPVSMIGFPLSLLSGTDEITLDMADLMMSTIDRIDDAMRGMEEAFAAALAGTDKSPYFRDCMKVMKDLVETFLIPEILNH